MNLRSLLTEQSNPASRDIDSRSTEEILRIINLEDQKVALSVAVEIPGIAQAVDRIVESIRKAGRLFYIGAGSSGRLGVLDAAECPPTFHVSPEVVQGIIAGGEAALARATELSEDDPDAGRRDLMRHAFTERDVLVGIAASGRTPYVLGAIAGARELGALTVGISCTPDSELARAAEIAITPLTGPEVIAGSTRMKAGTATKLVLNMISTAVMIRLGYVYGNLMVNVEPKNAKLEDRARRIVAESAQVPYDRAAQLLREAGGEVKIAIVMSRLGVDRAAAEAKLAAAGGRVAEALKASHG
ncbi:MAG TPA: N-acetylmuramic acid 6-phosphate etherase [Bryobacteraceae bacterium]|nr:N-acetylmuramic acid 6-phosphate etherase [Bryobacteraceae bacterium]